MIHCWLQQQYLLTAVYTFIHLDMFPYIRITLVLSGLWVNCAPTLLGNRRTVTTPPSPLPAPRLFSSWEPNRMADWNLFCLLYTMKKDNNRLHQRVFSRGELWRFLCKLVLLGNEGQTDREEKLWDTCVVCPEPVLNGASNFHHMLFTNLYEPCDRSVVLQLAFLLL